MWEDRYGRHWLRAECQTTGKKICLSFDHGHRVPLSDSMLTLWTAITEVESMEPRHE
jgi:hypothetical protein